MHTVPARNIVPPQILYHCQNCAKQCTFESKQHERLNHLLPHLAKYCTSASTVKQECLYIEYYVLTPLWPFTLERDVVQNFSTVRSAFKSLQPRVTPARRYQREVGETALASFKDEGPKKHGFFIDRFLLSDLRAAWCLFLTHRIQHSVVRRPATLQQMKSCSAGSIPDHLNFPCQLTFHI